MDLCTSSLVQVAKENERQTEKEGQRNEDKGYLDISLGEQPLRDSKERTARAFSDEVRLKFMSLSGLEIAVTCKGARGQL